YALEYRKWYGSVFAPPSEAHVEFWTYDLAHRRGPRKIGSWPHAFERTFRVDRWTSDGLVIESHGDRRDTVWERLDPTTGARRPSGAPRALPRPIRDQEERDAERRRPHIEQAFGEFALWDPKTFRFVPLFSIPVDPVLSGWDDSLEERRVKRLL